MKKYLSLIVVGILFVACQPTNELGTPFHKGQEVSLSASIGEQRPQMLPGMQRVSGKDDPNNNKIDLTWDEGDQILVKVGNLSSVFTLAEGAGTGDGTFNGFMPADGSSFHVEYPVEYSDEVLKEQTYVENGFGKGLMKMSTQKAGTLNEGFTLCSDNALLGLQLTGNQTLGKIVLTNLANEDTYTLYCEGVVLKANEATMFYIVVPVVGWEAGMRVEVLAKDGTVILTKEKTGKIDFDATEAMVMPSLEARGPGKRIGVFSVSPTQKVSFSQGNLQYIQSTKTWQFAENQFVYIGAANVNDGALADKIDLFGWSGKDSKAPYGVGVSSNYTDYQGEFVDWGTHIIQGDAQDTWRTLSIEEWEYIYHDRKNADQLLALATLEGVPGLILLPDNWQQPEDIPFVSSVEQGLAWDATRAEGSYFDSSNKDHTKDNIYTKKQWQKMEALGAVFLPCAGWRQGKTWLFAYNSEIKSQYLGSYWSCTIPQTSGDYYFFRIAQQEIRKYSFKSSVNPSSLLARGRSVRLVHDTIPPVLTFTVNGVSFNMMYVEGGTFMMGSEAANAEEDEKPVHKVTLSDFYIGETEVTQHLWEKVMGDDNNPSAKKGTNLPVTNITWDECQTFVEKLSEMTGMHFRLPTEAEWEYAARGGQKSKGYTYAGSNAIAEVAWYKENSNDQTHAVGQKQPNELGIYDMTGNVWEYCYDWHSQYTDQTQTNPMGATTGEKRVLRGGCYHYDSKNCTNTNRHSYYTPDKGGASTGLRIVLEVKK